MTPLDKARAEVEVLKACGISPTVPHCHVGENGTRCEFCSKPLDAYRHHPTLYRTGSTVHRGRKDW